MAAFGEEDPMGDAVASKEGRPMKERATERNAAAGGSSDGEKKHDGADATPAESAAAAAAGGEQRKNLTRLSQDLVDYILALEPTPVEDPDEYYARMTSDPDNIFTQEYIDESTQILRDVAETAERVWARFRKFQAWARAEFEAKGCVEVDDDYIANRISLRQAVTQADWDAAMARGRAREGSAVEGGSILLRSVVVETQGDEVVALQSNEFDADET